MRPKTFVARTTFSRRPPPWANQRPTICSVHPSPVFQPYTFAVSKKLRPSSSARSMMAKLSASLVSGPKFIVPRQSRLTFTPERPRWTYCIGKIPYHTREYGIVHGLEERSTLTTLPHRCPQSSVGAPRRRPPLEPGRFRSVGSQGPAHRPSRR